MTKEDKQRVIGKVVGINSDRFSVELLSGLENFNVSGFDDIHYFAQLNSYVIVPYQNYYIVSEVSGVREKDLNVPFSNPTDQILSKIQAGKFLEVLPIGTIKSTKENRLKFEFGVSVYPTLYSDVLYIKEQELDTIFNTNIQETLVCTAGIGKCSKPSCNCKVRHVSLPIGKSTIFPDYSVKLDIDKFFGSHSAILGNTGSGKSCTIASMLQTLYKLNSNSAIGSTFIIFDVNGEYRQAFEGMDLRNPNIEVKNYTLGDMPVDDKADLIKFTLPHWFLSIDEWALLLKASEKAQLPILRNALGFTSISSDDHYNHIVSKAVQQTVSIIENSAAKGQRMHMILEKFGKGKLNPLILSKHQFSSQFGSFQGATPQAQQQNQQQFIQELKTYELPAFQIPSYNCNEFALDALEDLLELSILYEEAFGNKQVRDYCSQLITRFKSVRERDDFNFLTKCGPSPTQPDFIDQFLGIEQRTKKAQVIIIDLNSANDETVEVISSVLSRLIFGKLKMAHNRNKFPVNLVLEEAHRYISIEPGKIFGEANRIFERIAKEGRKYGMFLLVSSQRPSELSKTVLSQCSNFIVHRIQNPEDLSHIRQITHHISETILKRMPSIPTQHALIFGHAVNLPTTFKVNDADPKPKSDNNEISINWFQEKGYEVSL
jgi:hypothetical protein